MKETKSPITRRNFLQASLAAIFAALLSACKGAASKATQAVAGAAASDTPRPTDTPQATGTPTQPPAEAPTERASATPTTEPSRTPTATASEAPAEIGVVVMGGLEIGVINKSGSSLTFIPNPQNPEPEIMGKAIVRLHDPQGLWRYNLEEASGTGYNFAKDTRPDYGDYGVLSLLKGSFEVSIPFSVLPAHRTANRWQANCQWSSRVSLCPVQGQ